MSIDEPYYADFAITRKPQKPPEILFVCAICEKPIEKPWDYDKPWGAHAIRETDPVCNHCTRQWGTRQSGPRFNRRNWHRLRQLSAMITYITWEVQNGRYQRRYW